MLVGKYLIIFLSGFIVSVLVLIILRKMALRFGLLVNRGVASVGGVGIGIAVILSLWIGVMMFGISTDPVLPVIATALLILIFGVVDDFREATVLQKLVLQSMCAALLIAADVRTHIIYLNDWGNIVITFFWILGITNAFNLLDIIDGLSAGVALVAAASLAVISFFHCDINIQILSLGLAAALAGFWVFNAPPAKIYLGNAGSHFLGFVFAALTLMLRYANVETPLALLSPIIILWLALLESLFLIYFRLQKGIIPFNKSDDHIAFRLMALGLSRRSALYLMLGLALFFAFCGIVITKVNNMVGMIIISLVLLVSFGLFHSLRRREPNV